MNKKPDLVTITIDRSDLLSLFAGGNYGGENDPLSLLVAQNVIHHAYETLSAINLAQTHENIGENVLWYIASQLEAAGTIVNALRASEAATKGGESRSAEAAE